MSSSANIETMLKFLGLSPNPAGCSHGYCSAGRCNGEYPYNPTAAFILEQMWDRLRPDLPHFADRHAPHGFELTLKCSMHPQHARRIDNNLLKSCIMIGTDIVSAQIRCSDFDSIEAKMRVKTGLCLAAIIVALTEYLSLEEGKRRLDFFTMQNLTPLQHRKFLEEGSNLDTPCDIVRFYDTRTPSCLCLNYAKEHVIGGGEGERLGRCNYGPCPTYCLDVKLQNCSGCKVRKYCTRKCQVADWPNHKWACKNVQKLEKQSLNKK